VTSWSCSCSWLCRGIEGGAVVDNRSPVAEGGPGARLGGGFRSRPGYRPGKWGTPTSTDRFGEGDGPSADAGAAAGREREDSARRFGCTAGPAPLGYGPGRTQIRTAPKAQPPGTAGRNRCSLRGSRLGLVQLLCHQFYTRVSPTDKHACAHFARAAAPKFSPFFRQGERRRRMSGGAPHLKHRRRARRGLGRGVVAGSRRR